MTTPNLSMTELVAGQSQPHVPLNTALRTLDAVVQLSVLSRTTTTPPVSPSDGDRYIVAAGATGAWSGHDDELAFYRGTAWTFIAPRDGWIAWVGDDQEYASYSALASPPEWATLTTGGGGGGVDVQTFTAAGTWTKPANAKRVEVTLIGGGGGGGSGRRGASASDRCGGGGGGSGGVSQLVFAADTLSATVAISVSGDGLGAPAQTTNDTNGNQGNTGKTISFGGLLKAGGGGGGLGGYAITVSAAQGGAGLLSNGGAGGTSAPPGTNDTPTTDKMSPGAGGAGSGIDTLNDYSYWGQSGGTPDGVGGLNGNGITAGAGGQAAVGGNGGSDTYWLGAGGGGGAAGQGSAAGKAGGNGGDYGGGGGGGGASLNGYASGAGGNGGGCLCVVTTYT